MANKILTPVTLWSDFDDSLPVVGTVSDEAAEDGVILRYVRFPGRQVGEERVNIFAAFAMPEKEGKFPALLILPDCERTSDAALAKMFARKGFAVLMPDYRGIWDDTHGYTVYPKAVDYANYRQAGRRMDYADETAKETCWYEWVAVARYALRFLQTSDRIERIGAIGLKAGGEIVWQLSATAEGLSCAVPVCAGGWRAYRGVHKFGENNELVMDDERYRFLAGVESQAYAPYAKCPVLMLCSTNDENFEADRAFDTYARINPEVEKSFYFAVRYNGCIGRNGLEDLFSFLGKYLKGMEMFIPAPLEICVDEDGGDLVARVRVDQDGEVSAFNAYMAEDNPDCDTRDWTLCPLKRVEEESGEILFYLNAFKEASRVYVFADAKYSCGFSVSSKIAVKRLEKQYANMTDRSRILYSSDAGRDSFTPDDLREKLLAGCFLYGDSEPVRLLDGPHGIKGVYSPYGLRLYRINDGRYRPKENALLKFDVCSAEDAELEISVCVCGGEKNEFYTHVLRVPGGDCWTGHVFGVKDFKDAVNKPLSHFGDAAYICFRSNGTVGVNNLIWL